MRGASWQEEEITRWYVWARCAKTYIGLPDRFPGRLHHLDKDGRNGRNTTGNGDVDRAVGVIGDRDRGEQVDIAGGHRPLLLHRHRRRDRWR